MSAPLSTSLSWGFVALAAATLALMTLGAVVRAEGAGLACPDWPLCFGQPIPTFNFQIALEWGHRVLAGSVSLGLAVLTALLLRDPDLRARRGRALAAAWILLGVQVVLGGLTVLLHLAPWTVTAHLLVGSTFCGTLLWIARDLAEGEPAPDARPLPTGASVLIVGTAVVLFAQILVGGLVSSQAAGLACAHFPTCDGQEYFPSLTGLVGIHVLHRIGACAVLLAFVALVLSTRRLGRVGAVSRVGLRIVIVQLALGAANVVTRLPVELTALHTALAAALFLVTTLLVRDWIRLRSGSILPEGTLHAAEAR